MPFGQEGLVVTWVGPVPKEAKVTFTDGKIFSAAARVMGPEVPNDLPKKYTYKLRKAELFNASMHWDLDELTRWEERHGIEEMEEEPLSIFRDYLERGHPIFGALVQHPPVANPREFRACSVVLQRAVIVFDEGRENLFLRSYFHSAQDDENFVNFVPRGGVEMSFASDTIWFPLELTRVIQEPAAQVVLDILTSEPLDSERLPHPFQAVRSEASFGEVPEHMEYRGRNYHVTRVAGQLSSGERWEDLNLAV
jgi:hypothetical protein